MEKAIKTMIQTVKTMIKDPEFILTHRTKETNFIRNRKVRFETIMQFILGLSNTSLDFERLYLMENAKIENISNAALCKARDKIQYTAFRTLLKETQAQLPITSTFCGYQVIAVDGMEGELPKTPEFMKQMKSKTAQYPQFHAVAMYDILNNHYVDAEIQMSIANERKLAIELLENYTGDETIFLYDRGFPSVALIQKLQQKHKFVARVSSSFLKEVNSFTQSKKVDEIVHIEYTEQRARIGKVKDIELPYTFDLRCVKIDLPSGEKEVLITNLPEKFSLETLGMLYSKRWGIETSFNHLKNAINIESFVGIKENSIKQEFYSALFRYNIIQMFVDEATCLQQNHIKKTLLQN